MHGFGEKIKGCIMAISYQERRKKKLGQYRKALVRLQEMEDDELHFEYISLKSEYEHRKNIMAIFLLSIVITALADTWKYFFSFIERIMQYAISGSGNEVNTAKVVLIFSILIVALITVVVFWILIAHTKRIYELNKNLMIVEKGRKERRID